MRTQKTAVSAKRFPEVLVEAKNLAMEKITGKLPKKDARVEALRGAVRALGETDREILRRDMRHWALAGSFVRQIGDQQFDLTLEMVSFTFGSLEKELTLALRRLVNMTGVAVVWVTRDEADKDDEGNPTVSALGAAARAMLDSAVKTAPAQTDQPEEEDSFLASLNRGEDTRANVAQDEAALTLVREWYTKTGRFAVKEKSATQPATNGVAKTDDRNAEVQATAERLATAGKGVLKSVPEPMATPVIVEASIVEPALEDEALALQARIDEINAEADALRATDRKAARAKEESAVNLEGALAATRAAIADRIDAELAVRAEEARAIAAAADAEAAVEANVLEPEDVHLPLAGAPALTDDYAKLVALAKSGDGKDAARARKLVAKVNLDEITKADAVDAAKTVGLIY